ncbi:unnamed protein product, partial [Polarella glacialis]
DFRTNPVVMPDLIGDEKQLASKKVEPVRRQSFSGLDLSNPTYPLVDKPATGNLDNLNVQEEEAAEASSASAGDSDPETFEAVVDEDQGRDQEDVEPAFDAKAFIAGIDDHRFGHLKRIYMKHADKLDNLREEIVACKQKEDKAVEEIEHKLALISAPHAALLKRQKTDDGRKDGQTGRRTVMRAPSEAEIGKQKQKALLVAKRDELLQRLKAAEEVKFERVAARRLQSKASDLSQEVELAESGAESSKPEAAGVDGSGLETEGHNFRVDFANPHDVEQRLADTGRDMAANKKSLQLFASEMNRKATSVRFGQMCRMELQPTVQINVLLCPVKPE